MLEIRFLRSTKPLADLPIHFILKSAKLKRKKRLVNWQRAIPKLRLRLPPVGRQETESKMFSPQFYTAGFADVGFVGEITIRWPDASTSPSISLRDKGLFRMTVPGKGQFYLKMGILLVF